MLRITVGAESRVPREDRVDSPRRSPCWFAQTAASWIAFRNRAARVRSTSLRATQTVQRQSVVQTLWKIGCDELRASLLRLGEVRLGQDRLRRSSLELSGPIMSGKA